MYFFAFCLFSIAFATSPVVNSRAGIFHGRHLPEFEQDLYLGIKYAPKPVRFAPSVLFVNAPRRHYNVSTYGTDCHGYGLDTDQLVKQGWTKLGEDCLHLNIVKPQTNETGLPVLLWIYGGGWQQGATSDPRYVSHSTNKLFPCMLTIRQIQPELRRSTIRTQ
jgi:acetylcholinesterase